MSLIRGLSGWIARVALCLATLAALFSANVLQDGIAGKFPSLEGLTLVLENQEIREPRTVLIGCLIALAAGTFMLITGILGRLGALLLLVVLALGTVQFLPFWEHDRTTILFAEQLQSFLINAGLCAGLLLLFVNKYAWVSKSGPDYDDDYEPY